jgi:hypothetical protein
MGPVRRVKRPTAVVFRIGVMIRDPLAAQVVEGAHHAPWNMLRASVINAVFKRFAGVMTAFREGECSEAKGAEHNQP